MVRGALDVDSDRKIMLIAGGVVVVAAVIGFALRGEYPLRLNAFPPVQIDLDSAWEPVKLDRRIKGQRLWLAFDALPRSQRTAELARKTKADADAFAVGLPEAFAEAIRASNQKDLDARLEDIENPPSKRAERAEKILAMANHEGKEKVCAAHAELASVSATEQSDPSVKRARTKIDASERAALDTMWKDQADGRAVVCGDGSLSGCRCAGPKRGCCSHHGGVAGCEPLPERETEIYCDMSNEVIERIRKEAR